MEGFSKGVHAFFKKIDIFMLICALAATAFGVILIASATRSYGTMSYIKIQLIAACAGVVLYFVISLFDLDSVCNLWKYLYVINLLLIGSLFFFGVGAEDTGNRSWIRFGSIGIQPAELGKILFILTLSGHIYHMRESFPSVKSILLIILHAIIPIALIIVVSHDLGMAIVYMFIFLVVLFVAGIKLRWFAAAFALVAAASPFIWPRLDAYQQLRIQVVFNPELDPLGKGYHAIQSKIAIGSGGLFGRGLGNGTMTQYSYLPAKQTDFIFAVAGEEFGMIGCLLICALLFTIIARCLIIGYRSAGTPAALVCSGVAAMLIFQTIENIGMCLGLLPVIGLTLPFFSYGGSSILTMFIAVGLISSA
ncbi:MAG: FtsW/RodA/SpoVE family cell cycle protein, partial [Clostridia bacterium]